VPGHCNEVSKQKLKDQLSQLKSLEQKQAAENKSSEAFKVLGEDILSLVTTIAEEVVGGPGEDLTTFFPMFEFCSVLPKDQQISCLNEYLPGWNGTPQQG